MKKWLYIMLAGVMMVVLSACGEDKNAEDIYSEALEASEDMESAEVAMDIHMNMESGDSEAITIDSSNDMQMTLDPLAMYMKGTSKFDMNIDGMDDEDMSEIPGMGSEQETEMYMLDDTIYMYNEMMGGWLKMDGVGMDAIEELGGEQPDPTEQIKMIEDYVDDVTFEKKDDVYTLTLEADGDEFQDLFQELMEEEGANELLGELGAEAQDMLDNMDVDHLSLEYTIDKETYHIKSYNMDMDYTMEIEGEKMSVKQKIESDYSNINNVDPIEVPDDVKDEAVDQGDMGF